MWGNLYEDMDISKTCLALQNTLLRNSRSKAKIKLMCPHPPSDKHTGTPKRASQDTGGLSTWVKTDGKSIARRIHPSLDTHLYYRANINQSQRFWITAYTVKTLLLSVNREIPIWRAVLRAFCSKAAPLQSIHIFSPLLTHLIQFLHTLHSTAAPPFNF